MSTPAPIVIVKKAGHGRTLETGTAHAHLSPPPPTVSVTPVVSPASSDITALSPDADAVPDVVKMFFAT